MFVYLIEGEKLSLKNDNLIITDKDKVIKYQDSCYSIFALFIVGNMSITSGLLQSLNRFRFTLILMTATMRIYGIWNSPTQGNTLLRKKQYHHDSHNNLQIAKHITINKINNQLHLLKKIRDKQDPLKATIAKIEAHLKELQGGDFDRNALMGIEGICAKLYFKSIFGSLGWKRRMPRAKIDTTNTLLDIGYTLLFNLLEALLNIYGFDLYCGVYHTAFYQRKSLVCDMVEPFRPIVDSSIKRAHALKMIDPSDFTKSQKQYRLYGKNSQKYTKFLLHAIKEHREEMFIYIQQYYRAFMQGKPIEEYPNFDL